MEVSTSFCNQKLTPSEQSAVSASLAEIKLNESFESTRFWGKIYGQEHNYLIIEATIVTHEIKHKFFFSVDGGLRFAQMPIVEPWMNEKCMNIASTFTGSPAFIYEEKKASSGEEAEEEEDGDAEDEKDENAGDEPPKVEPKLTELDRLSWTISKINDECCIVPMNSVILTSSKKMQKNSSFKGLSRRDANQLSSYLHFRTPRDPYSVSKYRKAAAMNDTDFLDSITEDVPAGCWKLQSKSAALNVSIKNLLWHGFEFKYQVGSSDYVQSYFGHGVRQNDLVFMM